MLTHCSSPKQYFFPCLILLIIAVAMKSTAGTDPDSSQVYVYQLCNTSEPSVAPNSIYKTNIDTTLSYLASNSSTSSRFYNTTVGFGDNKIYGLYFCRLDVTNSVCQQCVSPATVQMNTLCPGQKAAVLWYSDKCMVRYSNKPFLGNMTLDPMIPMWNRQNSLNIGAVTSNMTGFNQVLHDTLDKAAEEATVGPVGKRIATREGIIVGNLTNLTTIYTLLECSLDISVSDCKICLQATIGNITNSCNGRAGCTLMCLNCNIRYDTYPFYGDDELEGAPTYEGTGKMSARKKRAVIIGVVTPAIIMTVAIVIGLLKFVCKRNSKESQNDCNDIETAESLKFDFNVIRSATNNFSDDHKLGEGGFGVVFKGKLHSGEEIAVKRLSRNSKQGATECKTEVHLIAKLQHRNLVKLLGYCFDKQEKLLVYEFCPNLSLDRVLFDPLKSSSLNWNTRYKIICGIARGLLYLHEDSRLKIIHRDLKASNVLLDSAMNPKISDFGMARLFGEDETQGNTNKIAGTFGYMAPEYVVGGEYSVKSDVYSFGIIVLEIVSGQKNKFSRTENADESLLKRAWRLWNENLVTDLVYATMENNVSEEEAAKCVHIGLLCIQEDAGRRPRMTSVVSALNGDAIELPSPTTPHCFMTDSLGIEERSIIFTGARSVTDLEPR